MKRNKNESCENKYKIVKRIIKKITKRNRATVKAFNKENIPNESSYVMLSNHQGRFDGLAIINSCDVPFSAIVDVTRSNFPLERRFLDLLECKYIKKTNYRETISIFNDVANDIKNGKNYLIFPEGYYKDNKNTLQDFHSGCLNVVYQSKCPIVPICLYDTYKVYNVNSLKKVSCEVHYLKPIYYDEYCNLRKHELIKLVKSRIQEKIDELNNKNATK